MEYLKSMCILGGINIIAVAGMTLLTGYTGLFSMGHAAFMAIGAYTAAVLCMYAKVPFFIAILIGGLAAGCSSIIVGYPTLKNKLKGDYFAIAMLGFGMAVELLISNTYPLINGALGLSGIPRLTSFWLVLVMTVVALFLARNFAISQYGKNCIALRQQEIAAEMIGINIMKTKLWVLFISAVFVGIAGGLYAFFITFLSPLDFANNKSTDLIAAVVFGGMCSITGPAIAAFILVILPELLRFFALWRLVIYGLLFIVIMLFRPAGLLGYKEISIKPIIKLITKVYNRFFQHTKGGC